MTALLDCRSLRRCFAASNIRWVVHHMTSIRIAIASLLAAGALFAGGAHVQHSAAATISHRIVVAGAIPCCPDVVTS